MRSKKRLAFSLPILGFLWAAALPAFQANELTFKETLWAGRDDAGRLVASEGVFRRGEVVNLVLRDVGKFQAGPDGKHWFDIDMRVVGPTGQTLLEQKNLLGEKGRVLLKDGIAESPFGIYETNVAQDPGAYRMTLTIRDRIGGGEATVTKSFQLAPGLSYQKTLLARQEADAKMKPVEDGVFRRGEDVHLVVLGVGKFKKGPDGKNAFDIDMEVRAPDGKVVFSQSRLLGEKGRLALDGDIAESPYATFTSTIAMDPGTYRMRLTVRDNVSGETLTVERPFVLK